jgi:hypothetical protein
VKPIPIAAARASLDLTAHAVLTEYMVARKRKAMVPPESDRIESSWGER